MLIAQLPFLVKAMIFRLAYIDHCIEWLLARKAKLARSDRRARTQGIMSDAAAAAAKHDAMNFYANLRLLQPWKAQPLLMLKQSDGTFARSPAEIAARWLEHLSHEVGWLSIYL